jgi:hypothetical protein
MIHRPLKKCKSIPKHMRIKIQNITQEFCRQISVIDDGMRVKLMLATWMMVLNIHVVELINTHKGMWEDVFNDSLNVK